MRGETTQGTSEQRLFALGEAVRVLGGSRQHLGYTVADLAVHIATPINLNQFLIFRTGGAPVAFIAWAFLTAETGTVFAQGSRELVPADWNAGPDMWFVEFVAPFGHGPRIAKALRSGLFRDRFARSVRLYPDGRRRVVEWWGEGLTPMGQGAG
jgi:cytolysin-activating lysine-acyltransferase